MKWIYALAATLTIFPARAQAPSTASTPCEACAGWNSPQAPFRIYGNTYYVGPRGLSAILIDLMTGLS
jgi:metallo-beta-lactamase class B